MNKYRLILYVLLVATSFTIHAQDKVEKKNAMFNYGIKVGTNASTYNTTKFDIDGYKYDKQAIHSNKIGFSVSPFIRLTQWDFYLQTECDLGMTNQNFDFVEIEPTDNLTAKKAKYELTTYCIQVPLLFGYNFIDNNTYGMSIFTGPKTKFILTAHDKQHFENFNLDLYEDLRSRIYYWEIGLGVKIHRIFFDFALDIGLSRHTNGIIDKETNKKYYANRSDSNLSFSIGIIL